MVFFKKISFLFATIFISVLLVGCNRGTTVDEAEQYISTIEQIDIPNDVKVIGLGEATHGNVELQELKKDVFEVLNKKENVHVFVLEADFGGGQQINRFILGGNGTAEEAVNAFDYSIYKTKQMIDLIQWMHDYNATASEDEKIYFYGNDMQRYDYSKKGLLDYYEVVNMDAEQKYAEQLEHASNNTMRSLSTSQLKEIDNALDNIVLDLQSNKMVYVEQSSPEAFAFALQYAQLMKQRTALFLNDGDYSQLRDQYLADNLQWISEFEATRGHDMVLFSGHNGHVEKTSASLAGYKSMGSYLNDIYGPKYFAIGTDLINSEFQALNRNSDKRETFTVKNHNGLVDAFSEVEPNIFYVGFEKAEESKDFSEIINKEQKMINTGDDFKSWYKISKMFYTIKMTPSQAYDGIIIVKEANPTTVIE